MRQGEFSVTRGVSATSVVIIISLWGRVLAEGLGQTQYCYFITQSVVRGREPASWGHKLQRTLTTSFIFSQNVVFSHLLFLTSELPEMLKTVSYLESTEYDGKQLSWPTHVGILYSLGEPPSSPPLLQLYTWKMWRWNPEFLCFRPQFVVQGPIASSSWGIFLELLIWIRICFVITPLGRFTCILNYI